MNSSRLPNWVGTILVLTLPAITLLGVTSMFLIIPYDNLNMMIQKMMFIVFLTGPMAAALAANLIFPKGTSLWRSILFTLPYSLMFLILFSMVPLIIEYYDVHNVYNGGLYGVAFISATMCLPVFWLGAVLCTWIGARTGKAIRNRKKPAAGVPSSTRIDPASEAGRGDG